MTWTTKPIQKQKFDISERERIGIKIPVKVPELTAGSHKIYSLASAELKALRNYPSANQISVLNTSSYLISVKLDYSDHRMFFVPAKAQITVTMLDYQAFTVTNEDTSTITANKVIVQAIYEPENEINIVR